jgi:hypothetical protein
MIKDVLSSGFVLGFTGVVGFMAIKGWIDRGKGMAKNAEAPGEGTGFSGVLADKPVQYSPTAAGHEVVGLSPDAPATTLTPCCRVPVNAVNPMIPLIPDKPFVTVETSNNGGNRFGSLTRNSGDDTTMGRFGQMALSPSVNDGFTDGSRVMSLSEWRRSYDIQRVSDTMLIGRPMSGGEQVNLRRV